MFQVPAQIHLYLFPYRITHISLENLRCKAIFVHTKNIQGVSIDVSPREVDQPPTCFFDPKKGRALEETTIKTSETPCLDL